jgi:ABC-type antimicrobial peptide transport system permease subunit
MSRRISLAGLMALIFVFAIGVAALRDASETWTGIVLLLTLGLLCVSVFGVIYRSGGRRAWWLGFGLFGWGYAALTLAPWSKPEKLPTGVLLDYLYVRMSPRKVVAMEPFAASAGLDDGQFIVLDPSPSHDSLPEVPIVDPID